LTILKFDSKQRNLIQHHKLFAKIDFPKTGICSTRMYTRSDDVCTY